MKVCIIFFNIGGYHVARLEAARLACESRGWSLSAIQIAGNTTEHPWGDILLSDYVHTLKPQHVGSDFALGDSTPLVAALNSINPDVVAIPGWGFDFARAALGWARKRSRIPILMSESKHNDSPRRWYTELAKRYIYVRHFRAAIVGGADHKKYLLSLGMDPASVFAGYDVVDNDFYVSHTDRLRASDGMNRRSVIPSGNRFFLSSNRFIERKNLHFLIEAFEKYRLQLAGDVGFHLVLLGDGQLMNGLKSAADDKGLAQYVHFPGFVSYSETVEWYAAASGFVHPALSEQWGLVVNEAMASELPVLVSQSCGCASELVIERVTGFTFDPTNVDELAHQMTLIASNEPLRTQMGRAAREHIQQNFSPKDFAAGLLAAISSAI